MSDASQEAVITLLEQATLVSRGSIVGAQVLLELDGWDSMGMVMFLGLVEEHLRLELSVAELRDCLSAGELASLVAARAAELAPGKHLAES